MKFIKDKSANVGDLVSAHFLVTYSLANISREKIITTYKSMYNVVFLGLCEYQHVPNHKLLFFYAGEIGMFYTYEHYIQRFQNNRIVK